MHHSKGKVSGLSPELLRKGTREPGFIESAPRVTGHTVGEGLSSRKISHIVARANSELHLRAGITGSSRHNEFSRNSYKAPYLQ